MKTYWGIRHLDLYFCTTGAGARPRADVLLRAGKGVSRISSLRLWFPVVNFLTLRFDRRIMVSRTNAFIRERNLKNNRYS